MKLQLFLAGYSWGRVTLHLICLARKAGHQRKPGAISHWLGILRELV